jgi:2-polyprenyl-6-methoxyphenol hydroxylase-like FAD-dependent oxidoreductase
MRVVVVGTGPTGLLLGAGLARRGHQVLAVDRDPGPPPQGRWQRRGVMQFEHAHGFRPQVAELLQRHWPQANQRWLALGARPREAGPQGAPSGGMASRRVTLERALRQAAVGVPRLQMRHGHVDRLDERHGQVIGCLVAGVPIEADLVVDAAGRSGRIGPSDDRPDAVVGGDCGISYVNRTYQLRPGAGPGPGNSPLGWFGSFDGYLVLLFTHERGHFTVVLVRPTANEALKALRHDAAFEAACRAIPGLADWTDPARSTPTATTLVGGALRNTYRLQRGLPGLVAVGDSVTTTAPTAGRGVAMSYLQVDEFLRLLDAGADLRTIADPFGAWCDRAMLPWVVDHIRTDDAAALRWQGQDVDLTRPLPSDLIVAAAQVAPQVRELIGPYLAMTALPDSLRPAESIARELFRSGWRPPLAEGPTADQLVELLETTLVGQASSR